MFSARAPFADVTKRAAGEGLLNVSLEKSKSLHNDLRDATWKLCRAIASRHAGRRIAARKKIVGSPGREENESKRTLTNDQKRTVPELIAQTSDGGGRCWRTEAAAERSYADNGTIGGGVVHAASLLAASRPTDGIWVDSRWPVAFDSRRKKRAWWKKSRTI